MYGSLQLAMFICKGLYMDNMCISCLRVMWRRLVYDADAEQHMDGDVNGHSHRLMWSRVMTLKCL